MCYIYKKKTQNEHFSNVDFRPQFTLKSKLINKRKPVCTTTMSLVFQFIWIDSVTLEISEPLSRNQGPKNSLKGNNSWLGVDI